MRSSIRNLCQELGGYVNTHLECRYFNKGPRSKLRPEWSDIFMWAVLVSQPEIAELLWTKTDDPLRMAVYASLLCRKVARDLPEGMEKDELRGDADLYESWAMNLLEETAGDDDASIMLLALPLMTRKPGHDDEFMHESSPAKEFNQLWPRSTLEAAIGNGIGDETVKLLKFISHRLCKDLVFKVFNGYVFRLQGEEYIKEKLPAEHMEILALEEAEEDDSKKLTTSQSTAALDASYIDSSKEDFLLFQENRTVACDMGVPMLHRVFFQRLCPEDPSNESLWPPLKDVKVKAIILSVMHFFLIPRVKAIFHTLFNAIFLILLSLMLCGFPFWGPIPWAMGGWLRPWTWQSGTYENGEDSAGVTELEVLVWLWTVCRLYSEVKQIFRQGAAKHERDENFLDYFDYFRDPGQLLDMVSLWMIFACAMLRVGVDRRQIPVPDNQFDVDALVVTQVLYAFVAILMFGRFTSVMKLSGSVGLLYVAQHGHTT